MPPFGPCVASHHTHTPTAVSQQLAARQSSNVITPELRKLKATIGFLYTACEHLAMAVNLDGAPQLQWRR
jgi:hypothetical protein